VNQKKVSVIIPAYNRENYIARTIDSVLNQTYDNIELIVVNDGSTDRTKEILKSYKNKIILLEHTNGVNKGQSASINLGLKECTGEYISILDSDDYWHMDKLQSQVEYIINHHDDVGLVYSNGEAVDRNEQYIYDIYGINHKEDNNPSNVLLDCYYYVPTNSLFKKALLKQTGYFDENLRSAQDHDMAIKLSECTNIAYLDKKLFFYRRHSQSISHKNAILRWKNGFIILDNARKRYPYPKRVIYKRKAVLHFRLFQCYMEINKYHRAITHLLLSGLFDPIRGFRVILGLDKVTNPH